MEIFVMIMFVLAIVLMHFAFKTLLPMHRFFKKIECIYAFYIDYETLAFYGYKKGKIQLYYEPVIEFDTLEEAKEKLENMIQEALMSYYELEKVHNMRMINGLSECNQELIQLSIKLSSNY